MIWDFESFAMRSDSEQHVLPPLEQHVFHNVEQHLMRQLILLTVQMSDKGFTRP